MAFSPTGSATPGLALPDRCREDHIGVEFPDFAGRMRLRAASRRSLAIEDGKRSSVLPRLSGRLGLAADSVGAFEEDNDLASAQ